jgi:2-dehydropantoate 2-reductase
VVRSVAEARDEAFDYVILANKFNGVPNTANTISRLVRPETTIVLTQNGIGNETLFRHLYPHNTILSVICNISCEQKRPGFVTASAQIQSHPFFVGLYDRTNSPMDQLKLHDFIDLAPSVFKAVDNPTRERWAKVVFNAAWNPASTILNMDTQEILQSGPEAVSLVRNLAQEAYNVGSCIVGGLDPSLPNVTVNLPRELPPITPSMLQDARSQKMLEVGPLCQRLVTLAHQANIAVPFTESVCDILTQMNQRHEMKA